MGPLAIKPSDKQIVLPVFKLTGTLIVPIPGILYKFRFSLQQTLAILHYFKDDEYITNPIISNLDPDFHQESLISKEALHGVREFQQFFVGGKGNDDWLLIGLIPQSGTEVTAISRILSVLYESNSAVITFQAFCRGEILDKNFKSESKDGVKETHVKAITNRVDLGEGLLQSELPIFNDSVNTLYANVDNFLRDFPVAGSSTEKSSSSTKSNILNLSPLASALNAQLSGDCKDMLIKMKALTDKFNTSFNRNNSLKNSEQFLIFLDLVFAILPLPKLEFLNKLSALDRLTYFKSSIDSFNNLFESLYKAASYVEKFYSNASDSEKSKFLVNQLSSLRYTFTSLNGRKNVNTTGNNIQARLNNSQVEDKELELIEKFVQKLPSDINPDGVKILQKDFKRLSKMPKQHSEYQVLRTFFEVILDIPFGRYTNSNISNVGEASKQLNDDHYGLYHVKKRLLQYISVLNLHERNTGVTSQAKALNSNSDDSDKPLDLVPTTTESTATSTSNIPQKSTTLRAPIILFVGPPGVGKTSLAKSVASALGRKFQRISLGGVRDEAEIRGHRRTYVGAMPGVIINALRKAGSMNPLILLDEIDKVCGGANSAGRVNGDPEAALLEVLDPEQNSTFTDHYVGFPVDISNVLFLCTANDLSTISAPLKDRTEIIEISGYTAEEKINIGSRFLLPKQIKANGLPVESVDLSQNIWSKIVREYIREAGVRNLERKVASICRGKAVEFVANNESYEKTIKEEQLVKYLGLPNHPISRELLDKPKYSHHHGVVNGLSYNSDGSGGVLVFEIISIPSLDKNRNSPNLVLTGRLGETLTESIKIGLSFIKSILSRNLISGINGLETLEKFNNSEIHLHVPMGGVSKDGPSAGITVTLALLSIALGKPVDGKFAMTGEITLRGKVLPIGGVGEKLLGASQFGIKTVLLPNLNRKDVIEAFFNDDDEKLVQFLNNSSSNEPELKVKQKLGIDIVYVDTFFDVIQAVWGDDVLLNEINELSTHL